MKPEKSESSVTRTEFFKETQAIRNEIGTQGNRMNTLEDKVTKLDDKVTKLDDKVNKIALEVVDTKSRVQRIEETMMTKEDGQKIIEHIDAWAQRFEVYDRKALVHDKRLENLETQSVNHETRITHLESSPK